jgi:GNAT superfamily N-acetyltransferase
MQPWFLLVERSCCVGTMVGQGRGLCNVVDMLPVSRHASSVNVRDVAWDDPAAAGLRAALSEELDPRLAQHGTRLGPVLAVAPEEITLTLLVEDDGEAVACGSLRRLSEPVDVDGARAGHEVKKLYVAPGHRRRGLATLLLAELRAAAAQAGEHALVLHTGTPMPEAVVFYQARGWQEIPPFGQYVDVADVSVCFGAPTAGTLAG